MLFFVWYGWWWWLFLVSGWNGNFFVFFFLHGVSLCKDVVWLNGNAYCKLYSNFHFVWLEFEFFSKAICLLAQWSIHVGIEIYVCIKPITTSHENVQSNFPFIQRCCWCRTNKKNIYFLLVAWSLYVYFP